MEEKKTLLLKSINDGRILQTSLLLKAGANVEETTKENQTPIIRTMFLDSPKIQVNLLKLLLRHGADVSAVDNQGRNAFLWGCYLGCEIAVKYLVSSCDINSLMIDGQDKYGYTSLHLAVLNGSLNIVVELVKQLKTFGMQSVFTLRNEKGIAPLTEAFGSGKYEIAKYLITEGNVSVDQLTNDILHRENFHLSWNGNNDVKSPPAMISGIIKNLSEEQDSTPSNVLKLLITNESFRTVALNNYKKQIDMRRNHTQRTTQSASQTAVRGRKTLTRTKSIKCMLPTMMNMYEEQHCVNYRPSSKNEFVPYSVLNNRLRTMTPKETNSRSPRNTLSSLPDINRLSRLTEPKFMRMSRSTSVQLPQMNSWASLRKRLKSNVFQEF